VDELDIDVVRTHIELPDEELVAAAKDHNAALAKPQGTLGRLEDVAAWFASVQGASPAHDVEHARVVVFAGDHGIAAAQVSAYPGSMTATVVRTILAGGGGWASSPTDGGGYCSARSICACAMLEANRTANPIAAMSMARPLGLCIRASLGSVYRTLGQAQRRTNPGSVLGMLAQENISI